ncbi:MAG: hypothetical protein GY722_00720, partial [bacterium]|nr:hypothetical protein [bacterium]
MRIASNSTGPTAEFVHLIKHKRTVHETTADDQFQGLSGNSNLEYIQLSRARRKATVWLQIEADGSINIDRNPLEQRRQQLARDLPVPQTYIDLMSTTAEFILNRIPWSFFKETAELLELRKEDQLSRLFYETTWRVDDLRTATPNRDPTPGTWSRDPTSLLNVIRTTPFGASFLSMARKDLQHQEFEERGFDYTQ